MDLTKSKCKTFQSEKDLNDFIASGVIGHLIAILPKMSHFVIFYISKEDMAEIKAAPIAEKKEIKTIKSKGN